MSAIEVFVVDDHPLVLRAVEGLVRGSGNRIAGSAATTALTLSMLERRGADVVVVDPELAGGDGGKLVKLLRERAPATPIVVFTGAGDPETLRVARAAGAQGLVSKSAEPAELLAAIDTVAAGRRHVDPRLEAADAEPQPSRALTPKQREVLTLFARGLTREEIAGRLGLSIETVRTHARNATERMLARNRVHAITLAIAAGEITPDASPL